MGATANTGRSLFTRATAAASSSSEGLASADVLSAKLMCSRVVSRAVWLTAGCCANGR